ncbi:hypothetical protein IJ556_07090 [bacterium]|nr:hypothetical protein [bacterium]
MKGRKAVAALFMSTLLMMSTSVFAGGATYDVQDKEVRSTLSEVKTDVARIKELLEIIKQKELAMEHLDKAATERRNDSMQKLSLDTGLNFVSENKNGINFGELLKAGAGGFLEKFTEDLSKQGIELKNFAKASPTISLKVGDFLLCFEGIANGKHFEGLTDPSTIKDIYLQNLQELSFAEAKIEQELADFEEKRKEADDKDEKRLEDITKAKDSKSKDKSDLWNKLASGEFNKLLGSIGALSSGKFGVEDIGSILDNKEIKTIFMKEGTESATAAQERTTSVEAVRAAKEMRDSEAEAFRLQARIKLGKIAELQLLNDWQFRVALGNAGKAERAALPVNPQGTVYRSGFEKYKLK